MFECDNLPKDRNILLQAGTVGKLKRPNGKTMHKSTAPPGDSGTSVLFPEEVAERQGKTDVWPHRSSHWIHDVLRVVFMIILFQHQKSWCDLIVPKVDQPHSLLKERQQCRKALPWFQGLYALWGTCGVTWEGSAHFSWCYHRVPRITKRRKTSWLITEASAHYSGVVLAALFLGFQQQLSPLVSSGSSPQSQQEAERSKELRTRCNLWVHSSQWQTSISETLPPRVPNTPQLRTKHSAYKSVGTFHIQIRMQVMQDLRNFAILVKDFFIGNGVFK